MGLPGMIVANRVGRLSISGLIKICMFCGVIVGRRTHGFVSIGSEKVGGRNLH